MGQYIDLAGVWDWNVITGEPFTPPNESPNARYCLLPKDMIELIYDDHNERNDWWRQRLFDFMTSNRNRLVTNFEISLNTSEVKSKLRYLRMLNLKKIDVQYIKGGRVEITKLPCQTQFRAEPDDSDHLLRFDEKPRLSEICEDINNNAQLGWLGPGTFPCSRNRCGLCLHVGKTPIVKLGNHGELHLTKRANCWTKNSVYVAVCNQCEEENSFTCYFGESGEHLKARCRSHKNLPCSAASHLRSNTLTANDRRAEIQNTIAAGEDPHNILRDWYPHITEGGIHPGQQRVSVVDIIPETFPRQNRERNLVQEYMFKDGDFCYLGMGRGCLNTYGGCF